MEAPCLALLTRWLQDGDTVTLGSGQTGASIDLGAGADSLTLAAGGNDLTVSNVETLSTAGSASYAAVVLAKAVSPSGRPSRTGTSTE